MKKDLRQLIKRMQREGLIVARCAPCHKHPALILCNGLRYVYPATPSDRRMLKNMECEIKRLTRVEAPGHNATTQSACKQ